MSLSLIYRSSNLFHGTARASIISMSKRWSEVPKTKRSRLSQKVGYQTPTYKKLPPSSPGPEEPPRPAWRYHEDQIVRPPIAEDEPYHIYNEEAQELYTKGMIEEIWKTRKEPPPTIVDPEAEPFRQVYEGNDGDTFSKAEVVSDPNVWYWVQRVLPKSDQTVKLVTSKDVGHDEPLPSGWKPPSHVKPDLPYFVRRTRNNMIPVYKVCEIRDQWKDFQRVKWRTIIDFVPERQPETITTVRFVDGDIRRLEQDLRSMLEAKHKRKILSGVNEPEGVITFKEDHVFDIVEWLQKKGF